jgi:hypothetical protein
MTYEEVFGSLGTSAIASRSQLSNSWRKTSVSRGPRARQRLGLDWTTKLVIVTSFIISHVVKRKSQVAGFILQF